MSFLTLPVTSERFGRQDFPQQETSWFFTDISHIRKDMFQSTFITSVRVPAVAVELCNSPSPCLKGASTWCFSQHVQGQQEWQWTMASSWEPATSSAATAVSNETSPGIALFPQILIYMKHCCSTIASPPPLLILKTKKKEGRVCVWRHETLCSQIHILVFFASCWCRCRGCFEMMHEGELNVFLL